VTALKNNRYALRGFYTAPQGGYGGVVDVPGRGFEAVAFWHTHPYTYGMPIPGSLLKAGDPSIFSRRGTAPGGKPGDIEFFINTQHVNGYLISPFLIRRFDLATRDESNIPFRNASGSLDRWKL
jgi:hypothetical protein